MEITESYPGTICVNVDHCGSSTFSGKFYHRYSQSPVGFEDPLELILKAEAVFEQAKAPMAFLSDRSFRETPEKKWTERRVTVLESEKVINHQGDRATFIVHVMFRQHASWQGKICWVEGKKTVMFRSALEMMKLMDSVLEDENPDRLKVLFDKDTKDEEENGLSEQPGLEFGLK